MTPRATLYVGVAAPLVEAFRVWAAKIPAAGDKAERKQLLKTFPHREIGAYAFQVAGDPQTPTSEAVLFFRTDVDTPPDRVRKVVEPWSGAPVELAQEASVESVPLLYHRAYLRDLKEALVGQPVRLVVRVGLTRQAFQSDLLLLRPELVALFCHGTDDGNLLLENGRGRAVMVSGEELLPALKPRPKVTFLAACHSQAAVERAGDGWQAGALIATDPETPVEVADCAQFQSFFYSALLAGRSAGEAFDDAVAFVAGSDTVGDRAVKHGVVPASQRFRRLAGHAVKLSGGARKKPAPIPRDLEPVHRSLSAEMRRGMDRFMGRQDEQSKIIDALMPLVAGRRATGRGDRRCVTLTKEGGIGKTALAAEIAE